MGMNRLNRRFIPILKRPDRNREHPGNRRTGDHHTANDKRVRYPRRPLLGKKRVNKTESPTASISQLRRISRRVCAYSPKRNR